MGVAKWREEGDILSAKKWFPSKKNKQKKNPSNSRRWMKGNWLMVLRVEIGKHANQRQKRWKNWQFLIEAGRVFNRRRSSEEVFQLEITFYWDRISNDTLLPFYTAH